MENVKARQGNNVSTLLLFCHTVKGRVKGPYYKIIKIEINCVEGGTLDGMVGPSHQSSVFQIHSVDSE